ncbi:MAG: GNAT family N-acetyltransferase [Bacilli bacterium]|nr:GNAT family N-acetyltransferase [Bacilli bacterium]
MGYSKRMLRLTHANNKDLPAVMKLFRRVRASLAEEGNDMWEDGYPDETDFEKDVDGHCLYIAKNGGRVVGSVSVGFDPLADFFPLSKDSRKLLALLDKCSAKEEDNLLLIHRLMVDPMDRRKGVASDLVDYLKGLYPHRLWIFSATPSNAAAISFYEKKGFLNLGPYDFEFGAFSRQILFCSPHTR